MRSNIDYLLIAGQNHEPEIFYTIEGEGKYMGQPSVFLRLFGCNLTCKGFASEDSPFGCDSFVSWSIKNKLTFNEINKYFEDNGLIDKLSNYKHTILKITGGEPLLRQDPLDGFIYQLYEKYELNNHIDFETNGTIVPNEYWSSYRKVTYTVSPKLSNNGDPKEKRYNESSLLWHRNNENSIFKFVVNNHSDIDEILERYTDKFDIDAHRVWLMPMCGSRKELNENSEKVANMCKTYGFNFSARLHLLNWDKALRV